MAGDALAANTQPLAPGNPNAPPSSPIPVGGVVYVVIDLVVPPDAVPARISHHIAYELPPDAPFLALFTGREVAGTELAVDRRAPLVIAPPLRGAGWVAGNSCCQAGGSHRFERFVLDGDRYIKGEAFGIDWSRIQNGRIFTGDGAQNEQHFAFGADVLAVADGTVVAIRDDMPEQTPALRMSLEHPEDFLGNHVIVQILPEVWAHYHHLQPGSIAVRVGEQVTTGQLIGRLGNSGGSFAPHLHFHLADGLRFYNSNGLPFVFDRYTLVGTAEEDPSAPDQLRIAGTPQAQTGTYPLIDSVVEFR